MSSNPLIQLKDFILPNTSSFSISFDINNGEGKIKSISAGGAVDNYDYIMISDPTGKQREFVFDFSETKKTISPDSIVNVIVRIMDIDDNTFEWGFSKNYAIERKKLSISNLNISQRKDGSRLVDIIYDYDSPNEIDPAFVSIEISSDFGETWDVPVLSAVGDIGVGIPTGVRRTITWDPKIDLISTFQTPICVKITVLNSDGIYPMGENTTGSIMIYPAENSVPYLSFEKTSEKAKFSIKNGSVCKNNSIEFGGGDYVSSSSSSDSDESPDYILIFNFIDTRSVENKLNPNGQYVKINKDYYYNQSTGWRLTKEKYPLWQNLFQWCLRQTQYDPVSFTQHDPDTYWPCNEDLWISNLTYCTTGVVYCTVS